MFFRDLALVCLNRACKQRFPKWGCDDFEWNLIATGGEDFEENRICGHEFPRKFNLRGFCSQRLIFKRFKLESIGFQTVQIEKHWFSKRSKFDCTNFKRPKLENIDFQAIQIEKHRS